MLLSQVWILSIHVDYHLNESNAGKFMNSIKLESFAEELCKEYSAGSPNKLDCIIKYDTAEKSLQMCIFEGDQLLETIEF